MSIIALMFLFLFIILFILVGKYQWDTVKDLNDKEYPLKRLYPVSLFIIDKIAAFPLKSKNKNFSKTDEVLKNLFVGEKLEQVKRFYLCKKITVVLMIIFVTNLFVFLSILLDNQGNNLLDGGIIQRPGINEGSKSVDLHVNIDMEDKSQLEENITVDVDKKKMTRSEIRTKLTKSEKYIDQVILRENESVDKVNSDLNFVTTVPSTDIRVTWTTDHSQIVDKQGRVNNEELGEATLVEITATLTLYGQSIDYIQYIKIWPKQYTKEEMLMKDLEKTLEDSNKKTLTQDTMSLPKEMGNKTLTWSEVKKNNSGILLLLGIITAIAIFFLMDRDLAEKQEKRNKEMLLDYPEIINKFTLLVGAGMSKVNAWYKITNDYKEKGAEKRYAYEEMLLTSRELRMGVSETSAYEHFGRRVKLLPYLRFSSMLAQSVKKGSSDLLEQLELESIEAFQERKELAKRLGEEAGTKLLMPMVLMLLIVLVIILVPAFLSFQI